MGIIPAYAGSTPPPARHYKTFRDHPRVCGEHSVVEPWVMGEQGSSPRMRGARGAGPPHRVRGGIIPAYAGSTPTTWPWATRWRDHPRVCGEHSATLLPMLLIVGSSPRMRGAPSTLLRGSAALGIIPAYAGSTGNTVVQGYIDGDHPRVCGEHRSLSARPTDTWGSSPRMRGALLSYMDKPFQHGIIPAYAGSTVSFSPWKVC